MQTIIGIILDTNVTKINKNNIQSESAYCFLQKTLKNLSININLFLYIYMNLDVSTDSGMTYIFIK